MHFLQFTDNPGSESAHAFVRAAIEALEDCQVYTNGESSPKAFFPKGLFSFASPPSVITVMTKRKSALQMLSNIPEQSTIVLTDYESILYLKNADFKKYRFIQLLPVLQSTIQNEPIKKALKKHQEQMSFISLSQRITKSWGKYLNEQKIQTVYPAYITPKQTVEKESHQSFIVGIISPLIPNQGIETVLQALHRNREIIPQLTVIIVGDGPEKKQLQWLVSHLDLRMRVQFVSTMDQYHRFLPNFDVVVLPDEQPQGFNPVFLHAFAQGIPIIASSTGINEELIEPGQTGLLFEPRNSHVLAQHLVNLYNHPDWMDYYRKKGPEVIRDKFSLEAFKEKILA